MKNLVDLNVGDKMSMSYLLQQADGEIKEGSCEGAEYKSFDTVCGGRILLYTGIRPFYVDDVWYPAAFQFTYHSSPYGGETSVYLVNTIKEEISLVVEKGRMCNDY